MIRPLTFDPLIPLGTCLLEISALTLKSISEGPRGVIRNEAPMADERAVAFFDGQNLYRHAKDAFGHHHPNYDPKKLFDAVCADKRWVNYGVRFYTGTPAHAHSPMWHGYWANRLLSLRRAGIFVESRPIRYRAHDVGLADGTVETKYIPQEKGIDLRLGLDVVRLARVRQLDVCGHLQSGSRLG